MIKINSFCLYYTSFTPLWIAILFIDIKNIFTQKNNLYTEKISIIIIVILWSGSFLIILKQILIGNKENVEKYEIIEVEEAKDITNEYLLAYVFPLFAFDFTLWEGTLLFCLFFVCLGFLCIKHNYFSVNIVLEMMQYSFYKCQIKNLDERQIEKNIISKKNLKINLGESINLKRINNEYMIEINSR